MLSRVDSKPMFCWRSQENIRCFGHLLSLGAEIDDSPAQHHLAAHIGQFQMVRCELPSRFMLVLQVWRRPNRQASWWLACCAKPMLALRAAMPCQDRGRCVAWAVQITRS